MNIKTITCHRVYNYGASLQAYALQHYLEKFGNEVEIIDFWPHFFHNRYNFYYIHPKSRLYPLIQKLPFLKFFYGLKKNRGMFKTYGRKKAFDRFEKDDLHVTAQRYLTSDSLKLNPPLADLYIAGSDQIWNTDFPNGHEPAYYLDFGKPDTRRATYAASFGVSSIPDVCKDFVKNKISKIDSVSIRESSGLKILHDFGFNDAVQVLDPVFLLSGSDWKQTVISNAKQYPFFQEKYILLYEFIGDEKIKQFAMKASRDLGYKIVSVNDFNSYSYVDVNVNDAGPCEFVSLIANSSLVITNSFHASAFSVILNKNFYTFNLSSQQNSSRMADFCNLLCLSSRYNNFNVDYSSIDYSEPNKVLNEKIKLSKDFIDKIIK